MISESLRRKDQEEQFAFGAYYGIIGVLALYNFILFFIVRDSSFFYYLLYVTGYGLIQFNLNGLAYSISGPTGPGGPIAVYLSVSAGLFYGRFSLRVPFYIPGKIRLVWTDLCAP